MQYRDLTRLRGEPGSYAAEELSRQKEEGAVAQDGGCLAHLKDSTEAMMAGGVWVRK